MMRKSIVVGIVAVVIVAITGLVAWADDEDDNPAALAKALSQASVSLEQGLKASAREGMPVSGKYEIEDSALQLSVYTTKGNQFTEVIVDHRTGSIKKAEAITDDDDLDDAKNQSTAMAKAKVTLDEAVSAAVGANPGYRAVSIQPLLADGRPVAAISLMKDTEIKKVTEKLD